MSTLPEAAPGATHLKSSPASTVVGWGWVIVVVASLWRMWAVAGAWFFQDDVIHVWQAANMPTRDFLSMVWNGHVEPGSWAAFWVMTRVAPQSWTAPFVLVAAIQALTYVVMWRLLRRLFPTTWLILVPLAVLCFGTTSLTALLWLSAALEVSTNLLFLALATSAVVAFAADRKGRHVVAVSVYLSLGLLFQERGLIVLPFLWFFVLAAFTSGGLRRRLAATWRFSRSLWVVLAAISVGYVGLVYLPYAGVRDQVGSPSQAHDMVTAAWLAIAETLIPTLVGGNWAPPIEASTVAPRPATGLLLAAWIVVGAAFAVGLRRRPRSTRYALLFVSVVAVLEVVPLVAARLDFVGTLIARDPRYVTFTSFAAGLAVGLALMPTRLSGEASSEPGFSEESQLRIGPWTGSGVRACAVLAAVGLAVSSYPSLQYTADAVHERFVRGWISTARAEAARLQGQVFADAPVPNGVIGDIFPEYQWASVALGVGPDQPTFNRTSTDVYVFDGLGKAHSAVLIGVSSTAPQGPDGECGYRVEDSVVSIPFPTASGGTRSAVRLAYIAQSETVVHVTAGSADDDVALKPGLQSLWVFPGGPVDHVDIRTVSPGAAVCVTEAKVGNPWPSS